MKPHYFVNHTKSFYTNITIISINTKLKFTSVHILFQVAPDRYEGVVCVPTDRYQTLLAKRNAVESKHKVM